VLSHHFSQCCGLDPFAVWLLHLRDKAARPGADVPPPLHVSSAPVICRRGDPLLYNGLVGLMTNVRSVGWSESFFVDDSLALEVFMNSLHCVLEFFERVKDCSGVQQRSAATTSAHRFGKQSHGGTLLLPLVGSQPSRAELRGQRSQRSLLCDIALVRLQHLPRRDRVRRCGGICR
jgi:hypothetical protein